VSALGQFGGKPTQECGEASSNRRCSGRGLPC